MCADGVVAVAKRHDLVAESYDGVGRRDGRLGERTGKLPRSGSLTLENTERSGDRSASVDRFADDREPPGIVERNVAGISSAAERSVRLR